MLNALIADDVKAELDVVLYLIRKFQFPLECRTAGDGEEALAMLRNAPADLLITDIRMPFLDGLALSEEALKLYPKIHIIIISGHSDFTYAKSAISLGVVDYLLKPITPTELKNTVSKVLDSIRASRRQEEMEHLQLNLSREQIVLQLIRKTLLPDPTGALPELLGSLLPASFDFFLVQSGSSELLSNPDIQETLKRLLEQLLGRPVQILEPEAETLLFLTEHIPDFSSDLTQTAARFQTLAAELYRCSVRTAWCGGVSPEICSVCYDRMKRKLEEGGAKEGEALPVSAEPEFFDDTDGKIHCIQNYISMHYREELNLEKLAGIAYVHPDYLSRIFKKETGMNLNRYIKLYRLEKACGLLSGTQMKITEISAAVGYQNCSYFIRSFNEQYGMSPEKYRRQTERRSR